MIDRLEYVLVCLPFDFGFLFFSVGAYAAVHERESELHP